MSIFNHRRVADNMSMAQRVEELVESVFDDLSTTRRVEEVVKELADLQLLQDALIAELRELTTGHVGSSQNSGSVESFALGDRVRLVQTTRTVEPVAPGDRIRIVNPSAVPGRKFVAGDHVGTVTRVTPLRVYYDTDSGQRDRYRAWKNVKRNNEE